MSYTRVTLRGQFKTFSDILVLKWPESARKPAARLASNRVLSRENFHWRMGQTVRQGPCLYLINYQENQRHQEHCLFLTSCIPLLSSLLHLDTMPQTWQSPWLYTGHRMTGLLTPQMWKHFFHCYQINFTTSTSTIGTIWTSSGEWTLLK